jgi:hypothetical protein
MKKLALELSIFADITGDHLLDLPRLQQHAYPPLIDARVVAGDGEVADSAIAQSLNQGIGNAAQAEAANCQQHSIAHDALQCGSCIRP